MSRDRPPRRSLAGCYWLGNGDGDNRKRGSLLKKSSEDMKISELIKLQYIGRGLTKRNEATLAINLVRSKRAQEGYNYAEANGRLLGRQAIEAGVHGH